MKRVQVHQKTEHIQDESIPIEERFQDINGTPHIKIGDAEECSFPDEVAALFYERSEVALVADQDLIDGVINKEHMCRCGECDVTRLIKFLTKHRGDEVFLHITR